MKKIFVIISNANGGIKTYENNLINLLSRNNQKVYLIKKKVFREKVIKKNYLITNYLCNSIWNFAKVLSYLKKIKKTIKQKQVVFIISNPSIFVLYFFLLKLFFRNEKIILVNHSHITNISLFQIIIGFISSVFSNFIDNVIFVSFFTCNWWKKYFFFYKFTSSHIIYNFLNMPRKTRKKTIKDNFNIGFVGRLDADKGFDKFLEIANNLKKTNYNFLIFGNKKYHPDKRNIKFCGWKEATKIYKKIELLLVTSPIENCPFSVLEAKSYGIPTLTISDGGIKEIIINYKDGISLKRKTSMKNLKKKIQFIKKNYNFFSKNCLKNSNNFDVNIVEKRILDLF